MKTLISAAALLAVTVGYFYLPAAHAEEANADCHVRENGENKKKKSGPCTVTEAQDNVWILLNSGESFTLKPRKDKKNQYKDQDGKEVKRTMEAGVPVYNWSHRHITVNMRAKNTR
jgi:hypothetical protein